MNQDETFRRLKRAPFNELWKERKRRMNESGYNFEQLLKDKFWTVEEFNTERKKNEPWDQR